MRNINIKNQKKALVLFLLCIFSIFTLSSVQGKEKLRVTTTFYPLAFLTKEILLDKGEVINIVGNRDIHDYQPTARIVLQLKVADLIIFLGGGFEPWLDGIAHATGFLYKGFNPRQDKKNRQTISVLDVFRSIGLDEDDTHEHDNHSIDPHVWLDPILTIEIVKQITASLVKIKATHSSFYRTNAALLIEKLTQLDRMYRVKLKNCQLKEAIVSHNAFQYLEKRYDFELHPISSISSFDTPSIKTLTDLKIKAQQGITHILVEKNVTQQFSQMMAQETQLPTLPINSLETGPLAADKDFFDIMLENLISFQTAFQCS